MSDLIGSEIPHMDTFKFNYGPLLEAIVCGGVLLIDEINLASQSVLEGLNPILDERRSIYVPEINSNFVAHDSFVVFASMNTTQVAGRKKLNTSFRSRFIEIHVDDFSTDDLISISRNIMTCLKIKSNDIAKNKIDNLTDIKYNSNESKLI
jgi:midasin